MANDTNHICDREKCDSKSVQGPKTTCIKCGKIYFLLCFGFEKCGFGGIKLKLNSECCIGLDPNSINFTCPNCDSVFLNDVVNDRMQTTPVSTPIGRMPNKMSSQSKTTTTKSTDTPEKPTQNPLITHLRADISKVAKQMQIVIETVKSNSTIAYALKEICTDTNAVVKSLSDKSTEHHTVLNTVADQIKTHNPNNMAPPVSRFSSDEFPDIRSSKRKRKNDSPTKQTFATTAQQMNSRPQSNELNEEVKIAVKKRQLIAGNSAKNGLGNAVPLGKPPTVKILRPILKSMYVSRMENTVTADEVTNYIKQNVTVTNDKDLNVRLLVKKDQPIEKLSFVSFRVSCTPELHEKLFDSSFWPRHVKIGEFYDNPRPKRTEFGDFLSKPKATDEDEKTDDAEAVPNQMTDESQKNDAVIKNVNAEGMDVEA
ncbi:MAG: hypothetical protein EOP42_25465 [Sphingobacteriaceae bacterium]|nr:MAG: hypothetical protein EOP42_25465 [Sphingobacteriaceae bacterium]